MTARLSARSSLRAVTRLAAMPWGTRTALATLVAVLIAGCGSSDDKSIPPDVSGQLIAQLHQVQDQVEAGNCELAQGPASQFQTSVDSLPSSVDSDTKKDLAKLADNLVELADNPAQCASGATGESGVTSTSTESSTTESTEPTTTSTATSTSTTTEPEQEQPSTPPSQGEGGGESQGGQGTATGGGLGTEAGGTGGVGVKPRHGGSQKR